MTLFRRFPEVCTNTIILLLVVFYFGELCIHYVAFILLGLSLACTGTRLLRRFGSLQLFCQFMRSGRKCFCLGINNVFVVALDDFFGFLQRLFDVGFFIGSKLFAILLHRLLGGVDQCVQLVACGNQFDRLAVVFGKHFRFLHHFSGSRLRTNRSLPGS